MKKGKNLLNGVIVLITVIIRVLRIDRLSSMMTRLYNLVSSEILRRKLHSTDKVSVVKPYRIIGSQYIRLKGDFLALSDLRMECFDSYNGTSGKPELEIGDGVSFGQRCHIGCIHRIIIGDGVLFGSNVLITDHSHGKSGEVSLPPAKRPLYSKGPVTIGKNSWICDNVCVLPNVRIGENCIVGAGTIVNKDVPDNCMAVGNPMKIVPFKIE